MNTSTNDSEVVPPPGPHGGDARALAAALRVSPSDVLDLSATMNPLASDVAPLIRRVADEARTYPDARQATGSLAEAIGIDSDRVLLTNGGSEAIALVAGDLGTASIVEPEFSLWRRHLSAVIEGPEAAPTARVRSNPNNPLGVLAGDDEQARVWDEAFYPLAVGRWTRGDADRGSLVVGSLTKVFSCPGLRLGYILAPDAEVAARLSRRQPMWSVNALALAALPALLDQARLGDWVPGLGKLRDELVSLLGDAGLAVVAADAPWVLVRRAGWLRNALGRRGVLVRDCTSFGLDDVVRIAVPGPDGLARLEAALGSAMAERP